MSRLNYGSFEAVLHAHITPEIAKRRLARILLTSPMVDARDSDKETQRKSYNIDDSLGTRLRSGVRGLPSSLRKYYMRPDALEYVKLCFSVDIVPRIQDSAKTAVLQEILSLVEQDDVLPTETKSYFAQYAAEEELGDFLAEVYMCAVCQKPPTKATVRQASNLPRQNRFFFGREAQLAEIAERFQRGTHIQGLSGMGGVGKTQIALQYAHA